MRRLIPALALVPTSAMGAVLNVPSDHPTLEEAVAAAAGNDRIELETGTYDVSVVVDKTLRIQAADGADVTITGTGTGSIFDVTSGATSFELRNISFVANGNPDLRVARTDGVAVVQVTDCNTDGFTTTGDGAFIETIDSVVTTVDGGMHTNLTAANGALIAVRRNDPAAASSLNVRNLTGMDLTAMVNGGAIHSTNANVTVTDSTFTAADADYGGAVFATHDVAASLGRDIKIQRSVIDGAIAAELGGAVYGEAVTVEIENSSLLNNSAGTGGGVYLDQLGRSELLIIEDDSTLSMNSAVGGGTDPIAADGFGAAFYAVADQVQVTASTISDSTGLGATGWASANAVVVTNSTFTANGVDGDGGALQANTTTNAVILGNTYELNVAGGNGGAVHLTSPLIDISGSSFFDNSASSDGGAVWADGDATITDSAFKDNGADRGGALAIGNATEAPLSILDTRFYRNGGDIGGALFGDGVTDFRSTRNHYCQNTALSNGGAVRLVGSGVATIRNDGGQGNNASGNGGVYLFGGFTRADMAYSTYVANAGAGGVMYASNMVEPSSLDHVAATGHPGAAFYGNNSPAPTADWLGLNDNGSSFANDWSSTTVANLVVFPAGVPVYNNVPGTSCETQLLQPHPTVGTPLVDVGPGNVDLDGSLADVGLSGGPDADPGLFQDGDGDGFDNLLDCDDTRPDANPDAVDFCNGIDDNCNGILDENPDLLWFRDADGDDFGDPDLLLPYPAQCDAPEANAASNASDCDDTRGDIFPDQIELCDGEDNNCDGITDLDADDRTEWYRDADFDGFGVEDDTTLACERPVGYSDIAGDCDDGVAAIYPGAEERCDTLDNDCNGVIDNDGVNAPRWYPDADQDGWGTGEPVVSCLPPDNHSPYTGDCDDNDPARAPGNDEICDGIDNDCDDEVDVDPVSPTYFPDLDLDGYGDGSATPIGSCTVIEGLVDNGEDCDDSNAAINPDAAEACDGVDEDCDGDIDENPTNGTVFFLDSDNDGFGNDNFEIVACTLPAIAAAVGGDCNDNEANMYPGNTEVCDFLDNNCDGEVDEDSAVDTVTWYADADEDGYGDDDNTTQACRAPVRHVSVGGDCDDTNPVAFPGRLEVCDQVDNDCDGTIDGPTADDVSYYYEDADGDGFGNAQSELGACTIPEGYVSNDTDCNDNDDTVYPGAQEIFGNAIDEDCDGQAPQGGGDTDTGEPPKEGCEGCSSASGPSPWFLFPLVSGLLLRRRR